jgi:hypothetical protein
LAYEATERELSNLICIGTFEAYPHVTLPAGSRSVPGMHVLKRTPDGVLKLNAGGKAKDRLCMRGDKCPRVPGVPTYSPCVKWPVFLIFCAVAVAYAATILQLDAGSQRLRAGDAGRPPVDSAQYMPVPSHTRHIYERLQPGFGAGHKYVRVLRALYGLPESSCLFHAHLDRVLRGQSFRLLGGEPCAYVRSYAGGAFILIVLHVDDFMMANCGCAGAVFEAAWKGIRDALNGYLKTAEQREFLGTDMALVGASAVDLGHDGERAAADGGGLDFWRGSDSMHESCSTHIDEACARLLPAAPPLRTDTQVPMSATHYSAMSKRESAPLDQAGAHAHWYKQVIGSCTWIASRLAVQALCGVRGTLPRALPQQRHGGTRTRRRAPPPLPPTHAHPRSGVGGPGRAGVEDCLTIYHDDAFAAHPHDSSSVK